MSIKNISPEELEALSKAPKKEDNKYIPKENIIKNNFNDDDEEIDDKVILETENENIILKPKKSYFEPDPVPYKLISGKHFIKKNLTSNSEIFVRPWSTEEELKLTKINGVEDFNKICNEIFSASIKSDIDIYELSIADKLPLFIFILVITYGSKVSVKKLLECEICENDETIDVSIDLIKDLEYKYMPDDLEYPFSIKLKSYPKDNIAIKYVFPSLKHEKFFVDSFNSKSDNLFESFRHIIVEFKGHKANGKEISKNELSDVIKFLNAEDKLTIRKNINEMSNYGLRLETDRYTCSKENCVYNKERKKIFLTFESILASLFMKLK